MDQPNGKDNRAVPNFATVSLSYNDSDDEAMMAAYNAPILKKKATTIEDNKGPSVKDMMGKENTLWPPNFLVKDPAPPMWDGPPKPMASSHAPPLGNYGYGFTYPPGSIPRDISSLPTYNPAIQRDLSMAAVNNMHPPLPPLTSTTATGAKPAVTAANKALVPPKKKPTARKKKSAASTVDENADEDTAVPSQSTKFRPEESDTLLDIIEDLKPIGKAEWEKVEERYVQLCVCIVTSLPCCVWLI